MTLAKGYNEKLVRAFPFQAPRVRWSDARESWQLEKRIHRARTVNPDTYPSEAVDSFQRFRDGYELIAEIEPRELPAIDRMIFNLRYGSVERIMAELGVTTAAQLADKYDERDRLREERKRAQRNERAFEKAEFIFDSFSKARVMTSGTGR
jgi:hypothetical protein